MPLKAAIDQQSEDLGLQESTLCILFSAMIPKTHPGEGLWLREPYIPFICMLYDVTTMAFWVTEVFRGIVRTQNPLLLYY